MHPRPKRALPHITCVCWCVWGKRWVGRHKLAAAGASTTTKRVLLRIMQLRWCAGELGLKVGLKVGVAGDEGIIQACWCGGMEVGVTGERG